MEMISWEDRDGARWIELEGELDHEVADKLRCRLNEATDGSEEDVVLVLTGVTFLGSMGIGVLLNQHQKLAKQGRAMLLNGIPPVIRMVLDSMNLLTVLREMDA